MNVNDEDLILYRYRDGLSAARCKEIEQALRTSATLRQRYETLQALLAAADRAEPAEPDQAFEQRLWTRLQRRQFDDAARSTANALGEAHFVPPRRAQPAHRHLRSRWTGVFAAVAALVLALGFVLGRVSTPQPDPTPLAEGSDALARRVLAAYAAAHLRATEGVLLQVEQDSTSDAAAALIENNRLYAAAAERAGNRRLAEFLREIEPLLRELANPAPADGIPVHEDLRRQLHESDLLFKLRAIEARLAPRGEHRA